MRLHARYALVGKARLFVAERVDAVMQERGITPIEMAGILLTLAGEQQRLALRFERHGNYEKKADEE